MSKVCPSFPHAGHAVPSALLLFPPSAPLLPPLHDCILPKKKKKQAQDCFPALAQAQHPLKGEGEAQPCCWRCF